MHHNNQTHNVLRYYCNGAVDNNKSFTYVKEGASVFQNELTGVWFILTVIHVDVEFISLEKRRIGLEFTTTTTERNPPHSNAKANPGDEAVTDILW